MIAATQLLSSWTPFDIVQAQRACPKLSLILKILDGQPISLESSSRDNEFRHYEKLTRQEEITRPRGYLQFRGIVVVPTQERPNLLRWARHSGSSRQGEDPRETPVASILAENGGQRQRLDNDM